MAIAAGAVNVAPAAGLVIDTDGELFAAAFTVIDTAAEVVCAPSSSVARAVTV